MRVVWTRIGPWYGDATTGWHFRPVYSANGRWTLEPNGQRGLRAGRLRHAPPPPPAGLRPRVGVLRSGPVGTLKVPVAPSKGAALGAELAVSARSGVDGDPLPLAGLPLQHAPHHPELNASPHETVSKGFSSLL